MVIKTNLNVKSEKRNPKVFDWGKENQLAEEDIKSGNVKKFSDKAKAMRWLRQHRIIDRGDV